jgi:hypothetical protein
MAISIATEKIPGALVNQRLGSGAVSRQHDLKHPWFFFCPAQ